MKNAFLLIVSLWFGISAIANEVQGKIEKYPIVMDIQQVDWVTGDIQARYRYANKESYLLLEGNLMQDVIWMEESYKGKVTGHFYIELKNDTLKGKWISGEKWFDVELYPGKKAIKQLKKKQLIDYQKEVSKGVSGGYADETFFINDMWFRDDNPQLEVGFNGGALVLEQIHADSLKFWVNTISGPTYHIAYASGIAHINADGLYECLIDTYENDTCMVYIETRDRAAHVWAKGNFICGFGARAYLDHVFTKISDRYVYKEEEISIDMMKEQE
jgi:hypothetical protein